MNTYLIAMTIYERYSELCWWYVVKVWTIYKQLKDVLSLKIKKIHIHLYSIATQYWKYAILEDIENWTRS